MLHVRGFRGPQAGAVAAGPTEAADPEAADPAQGPVVVVGGGPVGLRVVQELLQRTARDIVLLSDERWAAYNRVKLTPLLAGDIQIGQIYQPLTVPPRRPAAPLSGASCGGPGPRGALCPRPPGAAVALSDPGPGHRLAGPCPQYSRGDT